jgi:hypothetical protein
MIHSDSSPDADTDALTLRRLAVSINTSLLKLDRLHRQLHTLQNELDEVLEAYFAQIAAHLPWLAMTQTESSNFASETRMDMGGLQAHHAQMEQVMHQLYRKLARHCHPDVNPDITSDAMVAVNHAYHQRELGSLMLLAQEMLGSFWHNVAFTHDDMLHYHATLRGMVEALQSALTHLQHSDANALRKRLLMARLQGNDVIAEVAGRLQPIVIRH